MTSSPGPDRVPPPLAAPDADIAPPKRKGMATWLVVTLVVAALAVIPCLAAIVSTVAVVVPKMQDKQQRLTCMQNLSQIAKVYVVSRAEDRRPDLASGSALFLSWRRGGTLIRAGDEGILRCPADPEPGPPPGPESRAAYDTVDPANAPAWMCSYVGRDFGAFPIPKDSARPEPIAACLHHAHGAVIAFDDGSTVFLSREDLGLAEDDPIEAGPESASPDLRKLCWHPGRAGR